MIKEAIEKIIELSQPNQIDLDGCIYTDKKVHHVPLIRPMPDPILLLTLTGVVDYCSENIDLLKKDECMIHVYNYNEVRLLSNLDNILFNRKNYVVALSQDSPFPFGVYQFLEEFIINMQSMMIPNEAIADTVKLVGNLVDEKITTHVDDGYTQQVSARTGVARVESVDVANPIILMPYRTFHEIEQPASPFILRIKRDENGPPQCALFEADGGLWQNEAIQRIATWLKGQIDGISIVA